MKATTDFSAQAWGKRNWRTRVCWPENSQPIESTKPEASVTRFPIFWRQPAAPSFNGRTADSGSAYRGSNPWGAANPFNKIATAPTRECGDFCGDFLRNVPVVQHVLDFVPPLLCG